MAVLAQAESQSSGRRRLQAVLARPGGRCGSASGDQLQIVQDHRKCSQVGWTSMRRGRSGGAGLQDDCTGIDGRYGWREGGGGGKEVGPSLNEPLDDLHMYIRRRGSGVEDAFAG